MERIPKLPDEPAVLAEARNEAATLQALIADRIPSLTIAVTGAPKGTPVSIEVDGRAIAAALVKLPRKLDPGTHVVAASAPGYPRVEQSVELAPNEHPTVTLTLEPSAAPEPSAPLPEAAPEPIPDDDAFPSTLTYIGYGAAAVFLVAGGVTGGLSLAKASDAKAQCPTVTTCPETARPDRDASVVLAHVSTVSFALAGAGALLGTYGLLFDEGGLMTEARVGPGYLGIAGQF